MRSAGRGAPHLLLLLCAAAVLCSCDAYRELVAPPPSPSLTSSTSKTRSATKTPAPSASNAPALSPSHSTSPTQTPTRSGSSAGSASRSSSSSATATRSSSATASLSFGASVSRTPSVSPTRTPTISPSLSLSATALPNTPSQIQLTDTWLYYAVGAAPPTGWTGASFVDSAWPAGRTPSGYGYADVATTIPFGAAGTVKTKNLAVYYRKTFSFTRVGTQTYTGVLSMQAVDGCVVYANGVEVGRYNMPTGTIGFSTLASASMSGVAGLTFQTITIPDALVLQGSNVIAVEVHKSVATSLYFRWNAGLLIQSGVVVGSASATPTASKSATRSASAASSGGSGGATSSAAPSPTGSDSPAPPSQSGGGGVSLTVDATPSSTASPQPAGGGGSGTGGGSSAGASASKTPSKSTSLAPAPSSGCACSCIQLSCCPNRTATEEECNALANEKKSSKSGMFGSISDATGWTLVVVGCLGFIGFVGWFVWSDRKQKKKLARMYGRGPGAAEPQDGYDGPGPARRDPPLRTGLFRRQQQQEGSSGGGGPGRSWWSRPQRQHADQDYRNTYGEAERQRDDGHSPSRGGDESDFGHTVEDGYGGRHSRNASDDRAGSAFARRPIEGDDSRRRAASERPQAGRFDSGSGSNGARLFAPPPLRGEDADWGPHSEVLRPIPTRTGRKRRSTTEKLRQRRAASAGRATPSQSGGWQASSSISYQPPTRSQTESDENPAFTPQARANRTPTSFMPSPGGSPLRLLDAPSKLPSVVGPPTPLPVSTVEYVTRGSQRFIVQRVPVTRKSPGGELGSRKPPPIPAGVLEGLAASGKLRQSGDALPCNAVSVDTTHNPATVVITNSAGQPKKLKLRLVRLQRTKVKKGNGMPRASATLPALSSAPRPAPVLYM